MTTQKIKLNSRYQLNNEKTSDSHENFTKLWIATYKVNDKERKKNKSSKPCQKTNKWQWHVKVIFLNKVWTSFHYQTQ